MRERLSTEALLGAEHDGRVEVALDGHVRGAAARLVDGDAPVDREDVEAELGIGPRWLLDRPVPKKMEGTPVCLTASAMRAR